MFPSPKPPEPLEPLCLPSPDECSLHTVSPYLLCQIPRHNVETQKGYSGIISEHVWLGEVILWLSILHLLNRKAARADLTDFRRG